MTIKAIIFDFDGTLAKTDKQIFSSIMWVVKNRKLVPKTIHSPVRLIHSLIHTDPEMAVREMYRLSGKKASKEDIHEMVETIERLVEETTVNGRIDKKTIETIKSLKRDGYTIVISSLASKPRIEQMLERHGLKGHIDLIIGKEHSKNRTRRLELVVNALSKKGIKKDEIAYIGDMPTDVEAGKRVGLKSFILLRKIPVRWAHKQMFKRYKTRPDGFLKSIRDVHKVLK